MALSAGSKLGPYEIVSAAGAGGMGEVYRARDTRLDRTVAIKVLPSHLSSDPELKQRFEREAKAISSLNHPHICTLHDVGSQDGIDFLVMEYLEGQTLSDRLAKGPLPLDQVLKIGTEIAQALEKAHRQGIVHRDLKPGNIMLTKAGAKLMDFGLAKPSVGLALGATAPITPATPTMSVASMTATVSPMTQKGTIVGTFQYMAPEMLQGVEADARSDIFSFGCVLYEMITGRRAFEGKSQLSVLSAILEKEPEPIQTLQPMTPPMLDRVVGACLAKDPVERYQSAHDIVMELRWMADFSEARTDKKERTSGKAKAVAATGVLLLLAVAVWATAALIAGRAEERTFKAEISPVKDLRFESIGDRGGMPMLSPKGDKIVFAAGGPNEAQALWVRSLDKLAARKLDGTEGASHPFWSPDGSYIGFFANSKVNKIPVDGGPVTALADAVNPRGGSWGKDDVILFTPDFRTPLLRVSANGGPTSPVTALDPAKHTTHRWPWFLPDGEHFLYFAGNHNGDEKHANGLYFASLDGKTNQLVVSSDAGGQFAPGYLLYHAQTEIVAQPFNPSTGKLSGEPYPVIDNVRQDLGVWRSIFSVSQNGVLVYQPGTSTGVGTQLGWYDRNGKLLREIGARENHSDLRISPDGKRLALVAGDPQWELWVFDLERGTKTRLTYSEGTISNPSWSPDGKSIVYTVTSIKGGGWVDIRSRPANGGGSETVLSPTPKTYLFPQWSPDGKYLAFLWNNGRQGDQVWAMPMTGDRKPFLVVQAPSSDSSIRYFRISPNGKWVAYSFDETRQTQVYISPFPNGSEGRWQVSNKSGDWPVWRGDGKELFFRSNDGRLTSCEVTERNNDLEIGVPKVLFNINVGAIGLPFDVSQDGQRILLNSAVEEEQVPLNLVVNWPAELKTK